MTATSLPVRGFSTPCNGKMCAVGIGYGIGMDRSSCRDCWTLQDSITDLAPRLCSPFIGNQRIFVNRYSNSYGHQCQTLEDIAYTYQCSSIISPANRCCLQLTISNSHLHLDRAPYSVAVVVVVAAFFFHYREGNEWKLSTKREK